MAPKGAVKRNRPADAAVWLLAGPQAPEPTPARRRSARADAISRSRIIATAIAVADAEGAAAVTMRRIGRELGVTPMALYWHVADKDDLLALMVDAVEGEIEVAEPSGDWRDDLTTTARSYRRVLLVHGWMTEFIGHRRSLGPNELPHIERSLAALDGTGLSMPERFNVLMAVETYYLGFALREQQELAVERATAHLPPARRQAYVRQQADRLREVGGYPHLAALFGDGAFLDRDERFEFGLQRLLDGIEADVDRRRERP